jgi:hypothetical protein
MPGRFATQLPRRAAALLAATLVAAALLACPGAPKPAPGPPPPPDEGPRALPLDLPLESLDRVPVALAMLRGRLTVVSFFESGSDDALLLSDNLKALHSNWVAYGVRVLGIALDRSAEVVSAYVEGAALPYTVVLATEPVRAGKTALGPVYAVPLTLLLDTAGRLRYHHYGIVRMEVLERELDALRSER